jgi:ferredoxin/flavodoxin
MDILTLYFSGTGNSKFIAELFAAQMGGEALSIEEKADFSGLIQNADTVAFVYPIYGSRIPRIMREFVKAHLGELDGKKLVILCTQLMFSGDGARCFMDLLPNASAEVLYAGHYNMPNNVNNFWLLHRTSDKAVRRLVRKARQKTARICADIKNGKVRKHGFNSLSRLMGLLQGMWMPALEQGMMRSVRIGGNCTGCGLCVKRCPMHNLTLLDGKAEAGGNCTSCYRCINLCPERAIAIYFNGRVKWQYRGIGKEQ